MRHESGSAVGHHFECLRGSSSDVPAVVLQHHVVRNRWCFCFPRISFLASAVLFQNILVAVPLSSLFPARSPVRAALYEKTCFSKGAGRSWVAPNLPKAIGAISCARRQAAVAKAYRQAFVHVPRRWRLASLSQVTLVAGCPPCSIARGLVWLVLVRAEGRTRLRSRRLLFSVRIAYWFDIRGHRANRKLNGEHFIVYGHHIRGRLINHAEGVSSLKNIFDEKIYQPTN